jgi:hypothetical protein
VLLAEILGWCDERVRAAANDESYFDPAEMQGRTARYDTLRMALSHIYGDPVARLFGRAWVSDTLADCPTFGEWLVTLPTSVPDILAIGSEISQASAPDYINTAARESPHRPAIVDNKDSSTNSYGNPHSSDIWASTSLQGLSSASDDLHRAALIAIEDAEAGELKRQPARVRSAEVPPPEADAPQRRRRWWLAVPVLALLITFTTLAVPAGTGANVPQPSTATATIAATYLASSDVELNSTATAQALATSTAQSQAIVTSAAQATEQAVARATQVASAALATAQIQASTSFAATATIVAQTQATATSQASQTAEAISAATAQAQSAAATAQAQSAAATAQARAQATAQAQAAATRLNGTWRGRVVADYPDAQPADIVFVVDGSTIKFVDVGGVFPSCEPSRMRLNTIKITKNKFAVSTNVTNTDSGALDINGVFNTASAASGEGLFDQSNMCSFYFKWSATKQ